MKKDEIVLLEEIAVGDIAGGECSAEECCANLVAMGKERDAARAEVEALRAECLRLHHAEAEAMSVVLSQEGKIEQLRNERDSWQALAAAANADKRKAEGERDDLIGQILAADNARYKAESERDAARAEVERLKSDVNAAVWIVEWMEAEKYRKPDIPHVIESARKQYRADLDAARAEAERLRERLENIASGELGINLCIKHAKAALAVKEKTTC